MLHDVSISSAPPPQKIPVISTPSVTEIIDTMTPHFQVSPKGDGTIPS